jgi:Response regulator containing a CheY-like receiver domain and an HTH DNA-binding domain
MVLFNVSLAMQVILFTRRDSFRQDIPIIALLHVVVAGVFCIIWPHFLRKMNRREPGSFIHFIREFKLPVLILFLPILARFHGIYTHDGAFAKFVMFAILGFATPAIYSTFFTIVPSRMHGRAVGFTLALTILSWSILAFYLNHYSDMESAGHREANVFHVLTVVMFCNFIVLLISLFRGRNSLLPPPVEPGESAQNFRKRNIFNLCIALLIFFLLNGLQSAKFFPIFRFANQEIPVNGLAVFVIFCLAIGWILDRGRPASFRYIMLFCSLFIMLAPSALALQDNLPAYRTILALGMLSQVAIMASTQVVISRLMLDDAWFCFGYCYPYASRAVAIFGAWIINSRIIEHNGFIILLSTVTAFFFYYLISKVEPRVSAVEGVESGEAKGEMLLEPAAPEKNEAPVPQHKTRESFDPGKLFDEYGLSPREREVAVLLIKGSSTSDISRALEISVHTVKAHVRNILNKFNVPNRKAFLVKFINLKGGA